MPSQLLRGAFIVAAAVAVVSCSSPSTQSAPPASTPAPPPAVQSSTIASDLPLLRGDLRQAARPAETTRLAYEFAARHPEVLKYVPCFCGCERMGHEGNDDCFVSKRDAAGKVTEWETHGLICEVCIDVAERAMQMHNSGASPAQIRDAIDKRYADRPDHTPTPAPPKTGKGHGL